MSRALREFKEFREFSDGAKLSFLFHVTTSRQSDEMTSR